jgi:hypothetical protein
MPELVGTSPSMTADGDRSSAREQISARRPEGRVIDDGRRSIGESRNPVVFPILLTHRRSVDEACLDILRAGVERGRNSIRARLIDLSPEPLIETAEGRSLAADLHVDAALMRAARRRFAADHNLLAVWRRFLSRARRRQQNGRQPNSAEAGRLPQQECVQNANSRRHDTRPSNEQTPS